MKPILSVFSLLLMLYGPASLAAQAETLDWDDLVPEGSSIESLLNQYSLEGLADGDPRAMEAYEEIQTLLQSAPVRDDLDGKQVRLPGYAIPLEYDGQITTEFLLVPYFGACIHVPPPPSNQIVYVKSAEGVNLEGLFYAVWVTGELQTETVESELASAGYTLEASVVAPYE